MHLPPSPLTPVLIQDDLHPSVRGLLPDPTDPESPQTCCTIVQSKMEQQRRLWLSKLAFLAQMGTTAQALAEHFQTWQCALEQREAALAEGQERLALVFAGVRCQFA